MNKILSALGLGFAFLVLVVSVVRSAEESAYDFVIADEIREINAGQNGSRKDLGRDSWVMPGSPLYDLYVGGENIRAKLTLDTRKRGQLYLDYANERMGWVEELMQEGSYQEAMITAVKAVGYLVMAEEAMREVGRQEEWVTIEAATYAHETVLQQLSEHAVDGEKESIRQLEEDLIEVRSRVSALINR